MTVSELMNLFEKHYMRANLAPNTYRGYLVNLRNHILPYHGGLDPDQLTYAQVDELVGLLHEKGLSNTSIGYVLATYRKAINFGIRRGYCFRNLLLSYDKPRKEPFFAEVFSEDELVRILTTQSDSDLYPAVLLACVCGLRRGETAGIKREDITPCQIRIRRTVTYDHGIRITPTKSRRQRVVLIDPWIYEKLIAYDSDREPNPEGFFLRHKDGRTINPNSITRYFRKLCRINDLPEIRFHDLRHSFATVMMANNVHPKTVQQILGHSSVKVTLDLYSHASVKQQEASLAVLDRIRNKNPK